ncbi:MAG: hypothetical protein IIC61_01185 [Proteobacteria bacterium]|nr:hypothetical protein [Pseudomonadota bacterium]
MLILDLAYLLVFILLSPLWLLMLVLKPAFRAGLRERFIPADVADPAGSTVWLHGSSAGEIDLLRPLVGRIAERFPDSRIVISAFAISGYTFARKAFPDHRVIYFPADLAFIIRRFFRVLNPVLIIVVESEFWPNFFAVAERSKIPLCVLNGKMSAKSFLSHRRTGLIPWALRKASLFAVQTENHAARFRGLGISTASIHVTGNMKYDLADDTDGSEERRKLRSQYGLGDDMAVWIGGSIHRGEDEALAWAQSRLVRDGYLLQLIVVPRYPAEAPAMVDVFERLGLKAVCKTELSGNGGTVFSDPRSVLVVDTIGDLKRYYAMSDIAYAAAASISGAVTRAAIILWNRQFWVLLRCSGPIISVSRKRSGHGWRVMPGCWCTTGKRLSARSAGSSTIRAAPRRLAPKHGRSSLIIVALQT